jgi:hypothetical protein
MHADKSSANSRFGRLKAVSAGFILVAVGILRMLGGVQVVTHWTSQPLFLGDSSQPESCAYFPLSSRCPGSPRQRECLLEGESRIKIHDA